ncbi:MAG: class I SAM-dependent methyltransferase [Chitinophagaceae bacterium]|nr:class I SAM-dependent methyltransferase [Chitinophagaceae bacterium]
MENLLLDTVVESENDRPKLSLIQVLDKLNLNISSNSRGTDKGDHKCYVDYFYESEFASIYNKKNRLLEIGVRSGASLFLGANYFNDIEIIGLDIEDVSSPDGPVKEYINHPSITFLKQDAYNYDIANSIKGKFTILIDDGPHSLSSQIKFLDLYLSKLDENGVLIIEDILFAYRDSYRLMRALPENRKYIFEIYNFEKVKEGGGFLFVVRHNHTNKSNWKLKMYVSLMALLELFQVMCRRIHRGDFSLKDRRVI